MNANEVYALQPESISFDLNDLRGCRYNHIPEIDESLVYYFGYDTKNDRVSIKIIKDFDFDGRRCWRLATVWLDDTPVMIIQNAGREGDDHAKRYITNFEKYTEMIRYIISLIEITKEVSPSDIIDPNMDDEKLTKFFSIDLNSHFERY
jgi:hypothetical protein